MSITELTGERQWRVMTDLHLLPQSALVKTGPVDHADWTFRPLLGSIIRARFAMIVRLLKSERFGRLLEIGYGSGIFMPELIRRAEHLHGLDIHDRCKEVQAILAKVGCSASLVCASAERMPYDDGYFDAVVAVSSLEFVPDLEAACREVRRVLRPSGVFYAVTPGHSPMLDMGLKLLTGASASQDFGDRRLAILPTLERHFEVDARATLPPIASRFLRLYTALKLRPSRTA